MDNTTGTTPARNLPFNNLFLNSGFVHGINHWSSYVMTISLSLFFYFFSPLITFLHLVYLAYRNGMSAEKILKDINIIINPVASGIDMNLILIGVFGIFVFAALGLYLGLKKLHQKPLLTVMTAYDKFRMKRFWFAFSVWTIMVMITVGLDYIVNPDDFTLVFDVKGFLGSLVILVIFMPVQTIFEEVFFRGYLLQGLALIFKNGIIPLLITSLLFGAAHMENPEVDKYGWTLMLPYYTGFGLFLGVISLLDEGLELAIGIHLANNIVSSLLVSSQDSVLKTYSVLESTGENVIAQIGFTAIMLLLAFAVFLWRYRWKNFRLIIK